MINDVIAIAKAAGKEILNFYLSPHLLKTSFKSDDSPVTLADLASNQIITDCLHFLTPQITIISEETPIDSSQHNIDTFWLIDPLDGTKEFINQRDHFTINIALIENCQPVLGVLYAPALNECYWAVLGEGAFYNGERIFNNRQEADYTALVSSFHMNTATEDFLTGHGISKKLHIGSALKFGHLASGRADIYPRLSPCKLWDIGAGHIIIKEAGCTLRYLKSNETPKYTLSNIQVSSFIAARISSSKSTSANTSI